MTLGADPLVTAISLASFLGGSPIPAFIIRKKAKGHGTGAWIEGRGNIFTGSCVALVEDVVTTGGTLIKAIRKVQESGLNVSQVLTVVDREEGGREALHAIGYDLIPLFLRRDILALKSMEKNP